MKPQYSILIVDDDKDILKVLSANLKLEGYNVITAENGIDAHNILLTNSNIDLLILDLNLPDIDGIQVCKKIRSSDFNIPIIMLTARDTVSDKVLGLECGADDYIVKPFNFLELSARIKSCLRRYQKEINLSNIIKIKELEINIDNREIYIKNNKINLTKTEFDLLLFLIKNKGKACSREKIKNNLWKDKEIYNWSRTIDVHITHIRKKLKNYVSIEAIPGIGYILK